MHFSAFSKRAGTFNKWRGLSSVCAKLEPASYKNNKMQEINVFQEFTLGALYKLRPERLRKQEALWLTNNSF